MPIRPENKHKYPTNWKTISQNIKKRANWQCECTGECNKNHTSRCPNTHNNQNHFTGKKVILTTAHLNHNPADCDPTNLKAMCQSCHLAYDAAHHQSSRRINKTLQAYQNGYEEYLQGTPSEVTGAMKTWFDSLSSPLPKNLLEIGSGTGRDARYFQNKGWNVHCTDATPKFVETLTNQGLQATHLNIITDPIPNGTWNLILANAVFLHFTPEETETVLQKIWDALPTNGILGFSLKRGTGSKWVTEKLNQPRFFQYWEPNHIMKLLTKIGYNTTFTTNTDWGFYTATKPSFSPTRVNP